MGNGLTHAVLAFAAGPDAGLGHRRRLEALATALSDLGVSVALQPAAEAASADIVVVDSYADRADDTSRYTGAVVGAIDDLGRDLAVDLVVDPSPGIEPPPRPHAKRVLVGASYALLEPGLEPAPVRDDVATVLVATGAADAAGTGADVAGRLAAGLDAMVRLVVGPWSANSSVDGVEAVHAPDGLGAYLRAADVVVTAGGVTLLESLALGRPTVVMVLAENQRRAAEGAAAAGAAVLASVDDVVDRTREVVGDADLRRTLAREGHRLVDGRGAERVAKELVASL